MEILREKAIKGLKWSIIHQSVMYFFSFAIGLVLARLLTPKDFGLLAMVTVFMGFAEIFKEFGIGAAIVQKQDLSKKELSTALWLNLLVGGTISSIFAISAPLIAYFYAEPILMKLTWFIAINLFLSSFSVVQLAMLQKELEFKKIFQINFSAEVIALSLALILALKGYGVWSLVSRLLARTILMGLFLWIIAKWKPILYLGKEECRTLIRFSMPLLGTRSMNYWVRNLDNLLIGKILGGSALGDYSRAYSLLSAVLAQIGGVVTRVAFPIFSKLFDDKSKVRRLFLKVNRLIAIIVFPAMAIVYYSAGAMVNLILGEQWNGVIPLLKVFALISVLQAVIAPIGIIFLYQRETKLQFQLGLFTNIIGILSIIIGLFWGAYGVAVAFLVATIINLFPNIHFSGKLIGMTVRYWLVNLSGIALCALISGSVLFILNQQISNWTNFFLIVCNFILGGAIYIFTLWLFKVHALWEIKTLLVQLYQKIT